MGRSRHRGERRKDEQQNDQSQAATRQNVMTALAELTDRYKRLNYEMSRRETLRWMVTP